MQYKSGEIWLRGVDTHLFWEGNEPIWKVAVETLCTTDSNTNILCNHEEIVWEVACDDLYVRNRKTRSWTIKLAT